VNLVNISSAIKQEVRTNRSLWITKTNYNSSFLVLILANL